MKKRSSITLFVLLVFIVPLTAYALLNVYERRWEKLTVYASGRPVADFTLTNQDGKEVSTALWSNKIVVSNFFFSHCPVVCPKMMANLKRLNISLQGDKEILINSFSVDPERDSVARLKKYADQFGIDTRQWDLLTGQKKDIYKLARNSFMVVATDGDGGPADFIHSDKLVLIDKQKRIRGYYDGTSETETNQLLLDIKKLKHED
jgi:protein SCO1/2